MTCLAIDDEPMALGKLEVYIRKIPFLELLSLCESPFEAMQVMAERKVDAVFIDISMPDLSGIDFIASLPEPPMVVFTTAYAGYAVDSYRLSAVDYLLKPFDFNDFQRAANKLLQQWRLRTAAGNDGRDDADTLYVKVDYKYVNIRIAAIRYIKGMSEYVQIYLDERKPLVVHITMRQIKERLPGYFVQVHRSFIVNMRMVREIERLRIIMDEDTRIAVGDSYKAGFMQYLRAHSLDKNVRPADAEADSPAISET